jgi:two-component system CheB/CheR fusion protein
MNVLQQDPAESTELYLKIFATFPALIWRAGLDMKCDYFNQTWLEFTGRTLEQEQGDGWTEGVHAEDLQLCIQTYVEHFSQRLPFAMYYRIKNRFGEYRWIKDIGRPFFDLEDQFRGYIGSCYDVTDEREKDLKLEEANRTKDRFFQMIAHDLRGPLGALSNIAEQIRTDASALSGDELQETLRHLAVATQKTSKFVNDLLTWSQAQLQGVTMSPKRLHLLDVLGEALEPLEADLAHKSLVLDQTGVVDCELFADREMLKTVLRNLVSNALKFSKPGTTIVLASRTEDEYALLTVKDFGMGMPADLLANLFLLGARTSRPGTKGERGSGLGLLICKEFAERNGAKLWAESQPGQGTTFTVQVPLAGQSDESPSA